MWIRALNQLKAVKSIGYLIFSIKEVLVDMKEFFFVLLISILGFAQAFYSISRSLPYNHSELDETFTPYLLSQLQALKFSYLAAMGDWDTDSLDNWSWVIFIFASVMQVVVMLNLLIAIISATFERVVSKGVLYSYKEITSMVQDYQNVRGSLYLNKHPKQEFLFFAVPDNNFAQGCNWLPNIIPIEEELST